MVAYWIMLLWTMIIGFAFIPQSSEQIVLDGDIVDYRPTRGQIWFLISVPLIFCALRSGFIDTYSYIRGFKALPPMNVFLETYADYKSCQLFYGLETVFKYVFIDNHHCWLTVVAIVQIACMIKTLHKYSAHIGISFFVFIASGMIFSWMFNGIKQFLAATILFACVDLILEKKWLKFAAVLVFFTGFGQICGFFGWGNPPWWLCGFHQTAIIMFPIAICCSGKMLNKKVWILLVFLCLLLITGLIDPFLEASVENSSYVNDLQYLGPEKGMNIWRFFVSLVPPAMVLIRRKQIIEEGTTPIIDLSVNMSFVSSAIYMISTVTSGIYIGRLPIYCELYNLILYPWLFMHPYRKEKKWLFPLMVGLYLFYFVYQMYFAYNQPYRSDVLTIFSAR